MGTVANNKCRIESPQTKNPGGVRPVLHYI